jgi:hypothetical protein
METKGEWYRAVRARFPMLSLDSYLVELVTKVFLLVPQAVTRLQLRKRKTLEV